MVWGFPALRTEWMQTGIRLRLLWLFSRLVFLSLVDYLNTPAHAATSTPNMIKKTRESHRPSVPVYGPAAHAESEYCARNRPQVSARQNSWYLYAGFLFIVWFWRAARRQHFRVICVSGVWITLLANVEIGQHNPTPSVFRIKT